MDVPKTLLLTSTPPGDGSVGEVFLREVCRLIPQDRLVCFAAVSIDYFVGPLSEELKGVNIRLREIPAEKPALHRLTGKICGAELRFIHDRQHDFRVNRLIGEAVDFGRDNQVEQVWAVLNSPTVIKTARKVAERLAVPLVCLIWDPPEAVGRNQYMDRTSVALLVRKFAKTVASARACACISDPMAEFYRSKYRADTLVLHRALDRRRIAPRRVDDSSETTDDIRIVFSGTNYAKKEFEALILALASVGWVVGGRKVKLIWTGNFLNLDLFAGGRPMNIEYLGYRTSDEMMQILSTATVAYLPYPFKKEMSMQARLSFPDKLNTYIEASCPVLYHGPEDSACAQFMRQYRVGALCRSNDHSTLLSALSSLIGEKTRIQSLYAEMERARAEELNEEVCKSRLIQLLGARPERAQDEPGRSAQNEAVRSTQGEPVQSTQYSVGSTASGSKSDEQAVSARNA